MNYEIFILIQQMVAGLLLFIGVSLICGIVPKRLKHSPIHHSSRVMGIGLIQLPISSFIYYISGMNINGIGNGLVEHCAAAINLCAYYSTSVLVTIAFLILLGKKLNYLSYKIIIPVISCLLYPTLIWLTIHFWSVKSIELVLHIAHIVFFGVLALEITVLLRRYVRTVKRIENFYADDVELQIAWIAKCIYLIAGLALISIISPFTHDYPLWIALTYVLYCGFSYICIYVGYHKLQYALLDLAIADTGKAINMMPAITSPDDDLKKSLSSDLELQIKEKLELWIDNKCYTKKGVTIREVSTEAYTNRTYLSQYINKTYNCSFKIWVTKLRLEEAKRVMMDQQHNYNTNEVADIIGCSSSTSFAHAFKKYVGVAPTTWRQQNRS